MHRLVILAVCGLTACLQAVAPPISHLEWAKKSQSRLAYGLFMKGRKVGWSIDEMKLGERDGKPVLLSSSEMFMQTLFDGEKSVKQEKSTTVYELTGEGRIIFVESTRREDGKDVSRRIELDGDKLKVQTQQGGRTLTRRVAIPRDTLAHHRELEAWLSSPRRRGDRFTKYVASWDDADVDSKQIYEFDSARPTVFEGLETTVLKVKVDLDGGKLDAELLPDTRLLTGTLGGLLTIKHEKESLARKMDEKLVDLMPVTSILIDTDLGNARRVDRLKLQLEGLGDFKVPASHRQVISTDKGKNILELKRDFRLEQAKPLSDKQRELYLQSTPRLQSDEAVVKRLSKKIVADETDALQIARRIQSWVYRNLRKSYSDNADTALEILDNKAGDCTEHSLLFVSLCRAAGVPAREVGGLAYAPGDKPAFGWHAWAEIHDGHQWVSVDPTWNQVYVDATHLKMSIGERDLAWTNVISSLKIRVIDFEPRR